MIMDNRAQMADDSHMIPMAVSMVVAYLLYTAVGGPSWFDFVVAIAAATVVFWAYDTYQPLGALVEITGGESDDE